LLGYALPCLLASAIVVACWRSTGGGQIGHLLHKREVGTAGWHVGQFEGVIRFWSSQFGYVFGLIAMAGMLWGTYALASLIRWWRHERASDLAGRYHAGSRTERLAALAIWAWVGLLPLTLAADWEHIGHAGAYLIEVVYPAAMLGILLVVRSYAHLAGRPYVRVGLAIGTGLALLQLGVGGADTCLAGGRLEQLTGVRTDWGIVRPDSGIKAAGWYVRRYVPPDATVMALHTNKGMEVPVSEYYLGRRVLAGYDVPAPLVEPLAVQVQSLADVLIVPAKYVSLGEQLSGFRYVCTFTRDAAPVRYVYARERLALPVLREEVAPLNRRYDREFPPRRIPCALPAPPHFAESFRIYQDAARDLKHSWRSTQASLPQ
jgi:hypothetical protein